MVSASINIDLTENHDAELYAVTIIFTVLAVTAAVLRIISTRMRRTPLGIDDYLVLLALVWFPLIFSNPKNEVHSTYRVLGIYARFVHPYLCR